MERLAIFFLLTITLKPLMGENIEVSVTTTSPLKLSTFDPNSLDSNTSTTRENPSSEKKNDSEKQSMQQYGQPWIPVYPAMPYNAPPPYNYPFYPGVNPNAVAANNKDVQATNYFAAVLPAAQMLISILRNVLLYFLVKHFVLKAINFIELIVGIRNFILADEVSFHIAKAALQAGMKLFAKLGIYAIAGAGLLAIGGIFTYMFCYLTQSCNIAFYGVNIQKALDKETVRSLMTPEKIASAAALVQDAIGKYQRLQKAVGQ
ncbi:uncharacterized protein LOC126736203 isoform X1 [Anthonomus grandis grandis]|uniref:uncharacterized protein LOC126736203 isoform X1 n=1 Tax=Anthonomus grandis grandis TaxID=2921223 RepID=UPI0021659DC1|nr:uncharacterized protein LOC126736203 isoform X1 [Anthonomus grandis grandis]